MIMTASDPDALISQFAGYQPPSLEKWISELAPPDSE
jgi:hypothetical protein